jgi:Asp-tRNA(Asn)/Glu-tRNA(Gln) amidotransferase A subunit family amidase
VEPLFRLGLQHAAAAIRGGRLSAAELTLALLERIRAHEPAVQAFQWLDAARAMALARQADDRRRGGAALGALHGIGIGVKDIVETQGIPTGMGSVVCEGYLPERSAAVVRRLEASGAFVLGKTVTTEFAYYTPGKTRNPWNLRHTPGGSSSGSAAAVAMGFVPAALGTQTNGSVIRPAAFCGVVGYKPTAGRIPLDGIHPFSPTLDQVGVFARSVPDAALLVSVLEAADGHMPVAGRNDVIPPGDALAMASAPRLAALRSPVWHLADAPAQAHFLTLVERLRAAGARVKERELPPAFAQAHAVHRTIMTAEGAGVLAQVQRRRRPQLSPRLNALIDEGLGIAPAILERNLALRQRLIPELDAFLGDYDAAITPAATGQAPADLTGTGDPAFCTIWSLCGVPAVSLPAGQGPQGLPLGLQVIAARRADDRLLAAARWCDETIAWPWRIAA